MIKPTFEVPPKVERIINKYYPQKSKARFFFYVHVVKVTELALLIAELKPELGLSRKKIIKGAMLHDIGIIKTKAPEIGCKGKFPYICHTYLGREMLEKEGMKKTALMCERHVGVGLSKKDIKESGFPLPHRDMLPVTLEEKLVCFADKFYSKSESHLLMPKPMEKVHKKIQKYGEEKINRFQELVDLFGLEFYDHV